MSQPILRRHPGLVLILTGLLAAGPGSPAQALGLAAPAAAPPGSVFIGGAMTALALDEDSPDAIAYVAVGQHVQVLDLRAGAGSAPTEIELALPEVPEDMALKDGLLFVVGPSPLQDNPEAPSGAWLHLYSVAEPKRPRFLSSLTLPSRRAGALLVEGTVAYVLTEGAVLGIDLSERSQLRLLGRVDIPDPERLARPWWPGGLVPSEDRLLVARSEGLFAIARPGAAEGPLPTRLWPGPVYDVASLDGRLFIVDEAGLVELALDLPSYPAIQRSRLDLGGHPRVLAVQGDRATVLGGAPPSLHRVDVKTPGTLSLLTTVALPPIRSEHLSLGLAGGRALVALGRGGLHAVDLAAQGEQPSGQPVEGADPLNERLASGLASLAVPPLEQVSIAGSAVAGAAGPAGLVLLSADADGQVRPMAAFQPTTSGLGGLARGVVFTSVLWSGSRLFAQSVDDGLWVLEASDLANPRPMIPALPIPGLRAGHSMARSNGYLYVPGGDGALYVVEDPAFGPPRVVGRLPALGINSLLAQDALLYGTAVGRFGVGHLHVLDLTRPDQPRQLRSLDFEVVFSRLSLFGTSLLLTGGYGDMAVLDLADPSNPREVERHKGVHVGQLAAVGPVLVAAQPGRIEFFTSAEGQGLQRLSRKPGPSLPWGRTDWRGSSDVIADGSKLWLLRHQAGLMQVSASDLQAAPATLFLPWLAAAAPPPRPEGDPSPMAGARSEAGCRAPDRLVVILAGVGAPEDAVPASLQAAVEHLAGHPKLAEKMSLVLVDRQARRVGARRWLAMEPRSATGQWLAAAPLRLDLGLAAASRWLGRPRDEAQRLLLVLGKQPDERSWRLTQERAAALRTSGVELQALTWPTQDDAVDALTRLTGDPARVWLTETEQVGPHLVALGLGCPLRP